jgi:methyl-accepting chemotaxis protein
VSVPRSPVARLLATLACLDAMFMVVIGYTYFVMLGIEGDSTRTAIAVLAGLWVVKVIIWMTIISLRLRPLAGWFGGQRPPADPETIREVAGAAYRAPFAVSVTWAVAFGGTCMLHVLVLYGWFPDAVPLGPHSLEGALFSSIGVVLGAVVMTFTLAEWLMAPLLESISLTAQQRGVALRGRGLTYRSRLVVFALMLALAPTFYLSGITYLNAARAEQRELSRRAEIAAAEAALGHGAAARLVDGWAFTYDAAGTIAGREAALALADRPRLARLFEREAAEVGVGMVAHPREGVIAFRTEGERRVAVVIPRVGAVSVGTTLLLIMVLVVIALWAPLSALFIANSTAVPVVRISEALARVGEGELSAAPQVPVFHHDEVGALARNYNGMLEQLRLLARRTGEVSKGALDVEIDVRGDLGDAFRGQVESLREIVGHIAQSAAQLAGAASEMYAATQEQEATARQQSIGVEEVSRTMESLLAAATHVTESTMGVLTRAERTRETTTRTAERIAELSAHASRIGEILETIREIADRSDLLALNASLEGTRAGEAGRGFALVAGEMRKLAERITASVSDIKMLVSDVRASVSATVLATEESTRLAEGTTESARQINLVTQQQRSGTEQAGQNMRGVASMITQSLAATQQVRSLAEHLKVQADNLNGLVARFRLPARRAETGG